MQGESQNASGDSGEMDPVDDGADVVARLKFESVGVMVPGVDNVGVDAQLKRLIVEDDDDDVDPRPSSSLKAISISSSPAENVYLVSSKPKSDV